MVMFDKQAVKVGSRCLSDQLSQIIEWIDPMPPTTARQVVNHRTALSNFGMQQDKAFRFPHPVILSKKHFRVVRAFRG